ncbi:hypothetical protein GCM10010329_66820 [Streptomyces spiroverticillatus]|uniref:GerMN domain-containing protein n=1 Tax=Streptomyces finlayi TaxID=67296 RepID=A0A918X4S7_9ACTN|nr:hypothetical protein [Streptomyces finlayi]GHA34277.1 hypothetical protein GCM10010329_66820 [Streptomyces spiroverticillatus]GHD11852.1 hypothetical protein GCM10010334_68370 [Streptomyces finlayi]
MTGTGARFAATAVCGLLLTACGVQPTGVIGAGEPATGLTKGLRLYFVSKSGRLEGVSRPDAQPLNNLPGVLKLLGVGPDDDERRRGLTSPVGMPQSFDVTGTGAKVVLRSPGNDIAYGRDDLATGQLVCTLARAQSLLAKGVRPDDVQVTFEGKETAGPYRCGSYLNR